MRPLLAALIVLVVLGGLQLYMTVARRESQRGTAPISEDVATGQFDVEVTLTFDAGPDPFALDTKDAPSLLVLFRGNELMRRMDSVLAGKAVVIHDVPQVAQGANHFYIKAVPQEEDVDAIRAIRVRVLRNDFPIGGDSIWSEPGQPVEGEVIIDVGESGVDDEHE